MMGFGRQAAWGVAALMLVFTGAAAAQENLDQGKTPAQLYASDCAICHKTPNGMAKSAGAFGLQAFLRVHYTASKEAAAAIAAYVEAVDRGGSAPERAVKRTAKPKEKGKRGEAKPAKAEAKAKGSEAKPVEAKAEAGKPAAKPNEKKPEADKKPD